MQSINCAKKLNFIRSKKKSSHYNWKNLSQLIKWKSYNLQKNINIKNSLTPARRTFRSMSNQLSLSTHRAIPIPPPIQREATPRFSPSLARLYSRVITILFPETPTGCPGMLKLLTFFEYLLKTSYHIRGYFKELVRAFDWKLTCINRFFACVLIFIIWRYLFDSNNSDATIIL